MDDKKNQRKSHQLRKKRTVAFLLCDTHCSGYFLWQSQAVELYKHPAWSGAAQDVVAKAAERPDLRAVVGAVDSGGDVAAPALFAVAEAVLIFARGEALPLRLSDWHGCRRHTGTQTAGLPGRTK